MNNCFRLYLGNTAEGSAHALLPGQWNSYRQFEKFIMPELASAVLQTVANPPGHYLPGVFHPPILAGEMALRTDGEGDLAGDLYPSRSMSIDLTGAGDMTAAAALVVSMLCAMTGAGTLAATIQGQLSMAVDFSGSGDLSAAMSGIASMAADLTGTGDLGATIAAYGNMAIDIVVTGTGLSTANVGQAVWSALAAVNNDPLTMGNKLNSAASAGDPWGTALPGAYPAGSAGYIVGTYLDAAVSAGGLSVDEAAQLFDVWQRLGLDPDNPMVTTATSIEAGGVTQAIDETAGPTITVTRAP